MKPAHKLLFQNNLHHSYWGLLIIAAEKLGKFTRDTERLSEQWPSCACGKLDNHVKRDTKGVPEDEALWMLGMEFSQWVNGTAGWLGGITDDVGFRFHGAAKKLVEIEKRSIELLKESLNETST
tara:strand:- start:92 stop:463 length:372 start_codon:yes stop_codon:yes gene_type:complete